MQKIIRTGHSAALTIPAKFFKSLNLRIGDHVATVPDYLAGTLTYKFQELRQLRLTTSEGTVSLSAAHPTVRPAGQGKQRKKPSAKRAKK